MDNRYPEFYVERIEQFVVEYLEDLPPEHKAEYRLNGIDPDTNWKLEWSYTCEQDANDRCKANTEWLETFASKHGYKVSKIYRVRDQGGPREITRHASF